MEEDDLVSLQMRFTNAEPCHPCFKVAATLLLHCYLVNSRSRIKLRQTQCLWLFFFDSQATDRLTSKRCSEQWRLALKCTEQIFDNGANQHPLNRKTVAYVTTATFNIRTSIDQGCIYTQ